MWEADLRQWGTSDDYVSVPHNTLPSEDSSDAGELIRFFIHARVCSRFARE
jgi:hypothetical protein